MARERLPMRKTREILRLCWSLGRSVRQTARSLGVSSGVARNTDPIQGGWLFQDASTFTVYWAPDIAGMPGVRTAISGTSPKSPSPPSPGHTATPTCPEANLTGKITGGCSKLKA